MRFGHYLFAFCLLPLVLVSLASAQPADEEDSSLAPVQLSGPVINTSRPSFTDAASTVPAGSLQVESGATYSNLNHGQFQWTVPETMIRAGLGPNTEVRATLPSYTYLGDTLGPKTNHFSDISVGVGQHVNLPGGIDGMVYPILNLPTGANPASSNALDPEIRLVLAKQVTSKVLLSSMMASRWTNSKNAGQNAVLTPTVVAYYSFSNHWTGFVEYAALVPVGQNQNQPNARGQHVIQTGLAYVFAKRHQLDARIAAGLNKHSPSLVVGVGYSFRIDGF